jgi:hypothetical protein
MLAVLCAVAPDIEQRLRQAGPGRGRAGAGQVKGAAQVFALADGLADAVKKVGTLREGVVCRLRLQLATATDNSQQQLCVRPIRPLAQYRLSPQPRLEF